MEDLVWRVRRSPLQLPIGHVLGPSLTQMDSRSVAALLKALYKGGLDKHAVELFDWLRKSEEAAELRRLCDVFTYTAMISLCVTPKELDRALQLSEEMKLLGIERNVHTFSALMNICIKCGRMQMALDVYSEMRKAGCAPNVVTYNTLIDVYGKTGQWAEAMKIIDKMRSEGIEPVTRTYNTLMIACNASGQWHEALAVYHRMMEAGHAPNTTTFNALISAYSKAGRLEKVLETFQQMVRTGCERSVITYSSLISACEKAGQWEMALQLFQDMHTEGCVPNVITYNSLITACAQGAQWERASEVFEQMQRQGCTPDVVTYTALISAYERGGQWKRALKAFESMLKQKCPTDSIVFNAIIDALWDTGIKLVQKRAVQLYRQALKENHFRRPPVAEGDSVELSLHVHTAGVAMLTLHCWLADLRDKVLREGADGLPRRVAISTGRGRQQDFHGSPIVKEAVYALLQTHGSPFEPSPPEGTYCGRLETSGPLLAEWLLSGTTADVLEGFSRTNDDEDEQEEVDLSEEAIIEMRCNDAFMAVKHFEATHCLNVQAMGYAYLHSRSDLVAQAFQLGAKLKLKSEVVHDGMLLLDRAMSSSMQVSENLLSLVMSACIIITAKQTLRGEDIPSDAEISAAVGTNMASLNSMLVNVRATLSSDTAAISSLRCLKMYLERIGVEFLPDGSSAEDEAMVEDVFNLVHHTVMESDFLNYRPSITAAAVLYCDRLHKGLLPFWPSSLALLTGYSNAHTPELAAAINGAQRLFKQMKSGLLPDFICGV